MRSAFLFTVLLFCAVALQKSVLGQQKTNRLGQQQEKGTDPPKLPTSPGTAVPAGVREPASKIIQDDGKTKSDSYLKRVLSPEILPNWLLFVVGSVGIYFAWRTLSSLEIQTGAFDTSAQAAKKSAEVAEAALKLAERADVLLNHATFTHGKVLNAKILESLSNSRTLVELARKWSKWH